MVAAARLLRLLLRLLLLRRRRARGERPLRLRLLRPHLRRKRTGDGCSLRCAALRCAALLCGGVLQRTRKL
jgi:hypothetical protein